MQKERVNEILSVTLGSLSIIAIIGVPPTS
jgi:hypothetical protein